MTRWHSIDEFPNMKSDMQKRDEIEFQKSIISDLDELEEDEYDEYGRKKKRRGRELTGINVNEISYVSQPAVQKKFYIVKGSESDMEDIVKKMSPDEIKVLQKAISILDEAKVTGDLSDALKILKRHFAGKKPYPYPYPVKKSIPKWTSAQRAIFGYSEEDLENCDYEEGAIEKSSKDNPFPSLSKVFSRNIQNVEEFIETENIESRFV